MIHPIDEKLLALELKKRVSSEVEIRYTNECASTNSECMQLGIQLNNKAVVYVTDHQTSGRGRRGNVWHSPAGKNIYCSIGFHKTISAQYLGLVSLQTGISIATVLCDMGFENIDLKWPNDLICAGKKLGGILIETRVLENDEYYLVIGFGLNVNQDMSQLDESVKQQITQPATSLIQLAGQPVDRQDLLVKIIPQLIRAIADLKTETVPEVIKNFSSLDYLQGKVVTVKTINGNKSGRYLGIEESGQIRVLIDNEINQFSSAEISLRESSNATY